VQAEEEEHKPQRDDDAAAGGDEETTHRAATAPRVCLAGVPAAESTSCAWSQSLYIPGPGPGRSDANGTSPLSRARVHGRTANNEASRRTHRRLGAGAAEALRDTAGAAEALRDTMRYL
jgi:hypothetical protein